MILSFHTHCIIYDKSILSSSIWAVENETFNMKFKNEENISTLINLQIGIFENISIKLKRVLDNIYEKLELILLNKILKSYKKLLRDHYKISLQPIMNLKSSRRIFVLNSYMNILKVQVKQKMILKKVKMDSHSNDYAISIEKLIKILDLKLIIV